LLVKNRGSLVAHQALEQNVLRGSVDNHGLIKKYVQRLRRKLGDNAREPRWIASVHGVGCRFVGPASTHVEESIASIS
jgi:DNA-binding winged helix-turn-helix (wHTH) protein